jgi:hypothetical protein
MSDDDPLDGAAVGETRTVRHTEEFPLWDAVWDSEFLGDDRQVRDIEIADAAVVGPEGNEYVVIEFEGEAMKTLPRGAFSVVEEPEPASQSGSSRWRRSLAWVTQAISILLPLTFAVLVAHLSMQALSQDVMINGQELTAPPLWQVLGFAWFALVIFILILWGVAGGLPRPVGGAR